MSPAHKQRLVGALVLVALFAIIVPAVLDFSVDERADMKGMEIPPGPDAMKMEVLPLDDWSRKADPAINPQGPTDSPSAAVGGASQADSAPAAVPEKRIDPAPVSAPSVIPSAAPPVAKVAPAVVPVPATPSAPKAEPLPAAPAGGGWVVQVASLSVEAKANELRDRLRSGGYPVFIERGKNGSADIFRVKAGPVAQREAADDLKRRIKESTGLDGLVRQNQ